MPRPSTHSSERNTNPYESAPTAWLIADRVRDLSHRKTQAEIASEAGFANANMLTFLKNGRNKVPLDRAVGATAAQAMTEIFGTPVTRNERGWLAALRDACDNIDPRMTGRFRVSGDAFRPTVSCQN